MRKPTHPIHAEIKKLKNHLKTEAEQHGVSENFGEQVVRRLRDRYFNARFDKEVALAISEFDDWCATLCIQ